MSHFKKALNLKLPAIQYLPAFEAAARHCSFKQAADELNITPSAISQQIKSLEIQLDEILFDRKQRQLKLTSAGSDFLTVAASTLNTYQSTFQQYKKYHNNSKLVVSMMPFIANEIVIPQLSLFKLKYPKIELVINTNMEKADLIGQDIDAAIRFGIPPWPELTSDKICDAHSALVATKDYFEQNPIQNKDDWKKQTLIHCRKNHNDWQTLMNIIGHPFVPKSELHFDCYETGMRAAEAGLGLAMAIFPISNKKIQSGKLIMMTDKTYPSEEAFYFVTKPNKHKQYAYDSFKGWIQQIFQETDVHKEKS